VFLDRDGTVSHEVGYVNHEDRIRLLPRAAQAVRRLNDAGFPAVLVTNQAGVARGYFEEFLVEKVHQRLIVLLNQQAGAHLDGIYYCPHHPQVGKSPYRQDCDCRKPKPGMLHMASRNLGIELVGSYLVSDHIKDVTMALREGLIGVLVRTGYGKGLIEYHSSKWEIWPDHVAQDLNQAVSWILDRENRGKAGESTGEDGENG